MTKVQTVQTNDLSISLDESQMATYEHYPDGKLEKITYPKLNDNSLLTTEYIYNALLRDVFMIKDGNIGYLFYGYNQLISTNLGIRNVYCKIKM